VAPGRGAAVTELAATPVSWYKKRFRTHPRGEAVIVKVSILASSSSGNSIFLRTASTRILIDAGLSRKATIERLAAIGERLDTLDAILISHEHSDHVSGLVRLAKAVKGRTLPVYLTKLTAPTIPWNGYEPNLNTFEAGSRFSIGDIEVASFTTPHDAVDPVAFCFQADGSRVGICTDLGYIPDSVKVHLRETDFLLLESNHDVEMLKVGPYPWAVKQRVLSRRGHLSNDVVSSFILDDLAATTRTLVLGHLSEHNNHPEIVRVTAQDALRQRGLKTELTVAVPRRQTEVFEL